MHYIVNYPLYRVRIHESVGLFEHINYNIGKQFYISTVTSVDDLININWKIIISSGLISANKKLCNQYRKIEHNIECLYYRNEYFALFLDKNEEWMIKFIPDNEIHVEVNNDTTAYFIIRKILHQISRYENYHNKNILLHSSCLVNNNDGYAFVGKKGAGKTTVLMNLLINDGKFKYQYLGNDISVLDNKQMIYSIYSKVGIGTATLEFLNQVLEEKYIIKDNVKYYYDLGEFFETFKVECVNNAKLSAIFILDNSNSEDFSCKLCGKRLALEKIREHILQEGKHEEVSDHPDWLYLRKGNVDFVNIDDMCKKVVDTIPCFLIQYNICNREHYEEINRFIQLKTRWCASSALDI